MPDQPFDAKNPDHLPKFFELLGARIVATDPEANTCSMEYNISTDYCHSGDIVQGGFITSMLDSVMSHAAFTLGDDVINVTSLEIKTIYLEPTRAGRLHLEGRVVRPGYKLVFLEGELYNDEGTLTATTTSVAKLIRKK